MRRDKSEDTRFVEMYVKEKSIYAEMFYIEEI